MTKLFAILFALTLVSPALAGDRHHRDDAAALSEDSDGYSVSEGRGTDTAKSVGGAAENAWPQDRAYVGYAGFGNTTADTASENGGLGGLSE